jgi:hypothetical protein
LRPATCNKQPPAEDGQRAGEEKKLFVDIILALEIAMTDWEPKITAFLCNWCSYGAADLAGVSRFQYPPNFRVIRIPCSARVSPKFILAALRRGADGVWVSG